MPNTASPDYNPDRQVITGPGQPKQTPMGDSVDMTQAEVGVEADFGPVSLAEERARGGWTKTSTGAPGLPPPARWQGGCAGGGDTRYTSPGTDE